MIYFLDTNTCIAFLKQGSAKMARNMGLHGPQNIKIPSMVAAELMFGALKSARPEKNMEAVEAFLDPMEIVSFGPDAARTYAKIRSELERKGTIIGPNDLVIAATACSRGATLVTNNTREFKRVKDLRVVDWL